MKFYSSKQWVQEEILRPIPGFYIQDSENGLDYIVTMHNGKLSSISKGLSISVIIPPAKLTYFRGETFRPEGIKVNLNRQDGSIEDISDRVYADPVSDSIIPIYYSEYGVTYKTEIEIEITDFDPEIHLIDFEYEENPDGTYTIVGWKETLHGEPSTIMEIPDYSKIIL